MPAIFRVLFFAVLCMASSSVRAGMACTPPPNQIARDISNEAEGSANAIARLGSAKISNKTKIIINNLYDKYPNADKLVVAQALISLTCEALNSSTTLTDREKLEFIRELRRELIPGKSSDNPIESIPKRLSKSSNNSDLDQIKVVFGTRSAEYDIIFSSGKYRLINVGSDSLRDIMIYYRCQGEQTAARGNLSPPTRVSGYSDNDRVVRYFETPVVEASANWIEKTNALLAKRIGPDCNLSMTWTKLYRFSFEDYSGREQSRFHKLYLAFKIGSPVSGELSTTSKQDWDHIKQNQSNLDAVDIDISDTSENGIRVVISAIKRINRWKIFN